MEGRSHEVAVLLMACNEEQTPDRKIQLGNMLVRQPINWERLHTLALRHRIAPFLYRALSDVSTVSETFLRELKNDCRSIMTDNLIKLHEYAQLTKKLDEQGIHHIPMKGVYLAQNSYPDASLRSIGDFDLLIKREDLFKTLAILESMQYRLGNAYTYYLGYAPQKIIDDLHEVSLFKPFSTTSFFNIDLHWEVECFNKQYASIYLEEILADSALHTEYQIILTVVHHGLINIWQHIGYVNDLYFLLKNQLVNWDFLLRKLEQYGLETIFFVGLYWCNQIWKLALPPAILVRVTSKRVRDLSRAYEKNWEAHESVLTHNPGLKQVVFFTNSQIIWRKKFRIYQTYVRSLIFRPSTLKIGGRIFYISKTWGLLTAPGRLIQAISERALNH